MGLIDRLIRKSSHSASPPIPVDEVQPVLEREQQQSDEQDHACGL